MSDIIEGVNDVIEGESDVIVEGLRVSSDVIEGVTSDVIEGVSDVIEGVSDVIYRSGVHVIGYLQRLF